MMQSNKLIHENHYSLRQESDQSYKEYARLLVINACPESVLDIGCGTGMNSAKLAAAGLTVEGVDQSEVAIRKYRDRGFSGEIGDIQSANFSIKREYECAFCSEVIEHLEDTMLALKNINECISPRGIFVLTTPNSAFWVYRIYAILGFTVSDIQHQGHLRFFSRSLLVECLENSGFEIEELSGRNTYFLIPERFARFFEKILFWFGFEKEFRFKTENYFYRFGHFGQNLSPFWSDTIICLARKKAI